MPSPTRWIVLLCLPFLSILPIHAQTHVRQITIRSRWGGLSPGPPPDSTILITANQNSYTSNGQPVAPTLIDALIAALRAPLLPKPDLASLGITQQWLNTNARSQEPHPNDDPGDPTPGQLALFQKSFSNISLVARLLPQLFQIPHTDDYPSARVEVTMDDNTKLVAYSDSQFAYMLPWCVGLNKKPSYNPAISRAFAALLPEKTVNKDRLADAAFASQLSEAVMSEIESAYDLQGVEDRVGSDLAPLRRAYKITAATIDPYLRPEYGPDKYDEKHQEVNLHATLTKPTFPPNVSYEVTLQSVNGHIQGIDRFLASAGKYEQLVLSVPWLKQYILAHPKTAVRISYVHEASLGDQALRRFVADMKRRARSNLLEAQQLFYVAATRPSHALILVNAI